jgi:hypothetical protein
MDDAATKRVTPDPRNRRENRTTDRTSRRHGPNAAAPLGCRPSSERGARLQARSMTGTIRSGSSLFITYSSTNHRIRAGISEYADGQADFWRHR